MRIRSDSVLSIAQAKDLLGNEALSMTDEEIQKLIEDFDMIAQFSIQMVQNFEDTSKTTD